MLPCLVLPALLLGLPAPPPLHALVVLVLPALLLVLPALQTFSVAFRGSVFAPKAALSQRRHLLHIGRQEDGVQDDLVTRKHLAWQWLVP